MMLCSFLYVTVTMVTGFPFRLLGVQLDQNQLTGLKETFQKFIFGDV